MRILESKIALGEKRVAIKDLFHDERLIEKTGIENCFESKRQSTTLLAQKACVKIKSRIKDVNVCILVTQTPDYLLPANSIVLCSKLGIQKDCLTFDFNQGCSGFVQALCIVEKIINTYKKILLVTSDRYRSKLKENDRSTNAVFSDGATASLLGYDSNFGIIYEDHYTDGTKKDLLYQSNSDSKNQGNLFMAGAQIWVFTRLKVVPQIVKAIEFCKKNELSISGIYIHQASKVVVEGIRSLLPIDKNLVFDNYMSYGNTVSSTIPILINDYPLEYTNSNRVQILAGFGVGLTSSVVVHGFKK